MRSWCHETVAKDWQKFHSTENYNKLALAVTEFRGWRMVNEETSMNLRNKESERRVGSGYCILYVQSFKDGIYRRDAVLETDSTVRYQLADIPLPGTES